jgi:hypothetical protein
MYCTVQQLKHCALYEQSSSACAYRIYRVRNKNQCLPFSYFWPQVSLVGFPKKCGSNRRCDLDLPRTNDGMMVFFQSSSYVPDPVKSETFKACRIQLISDPNPNLDPVLWNRNDLFRFRFLFWKSFGSGSASNSGSRLTLQFFSKIVFYKILPFQC